MLKNHLKISEWLWVISLWAIPLTVFTTLWQETIFIQGNYNPYLSFNLYVGEFFVFLTSGAFLIEAILNKRKLNFQKKSFFVATGIFFLSLFSIIFADNKTSALLANIHVLSAIQIFLLIRHEIMPLEKTKKIFLTALIFQSLVAILQTILQKSVGLTMLGESNIGQNISGVAKISALGHTLIRGYGTLPHANILGGFLGIGLLLLIQEPPKSKKFLLWEIILCVGFLLTLSKGAFIAIFLALFLTKRIPWKIGWPILGLLLSIVFIKWKDFLLNESFLERLEYIEISFAMLAAKPLGVGLSQFTANIQEFATLKLQPWQYQPVHNIYLLITNELGIWSGLAIIGGLSHLFIKQKTPFVLVIFILIAGLFDHYFISLPQGLMLTGFVLGISFSNQNTPQKPRLTPPKRRHR